jgi:hypothetical protein
LQGKFQHCRMLRPQRRHSPRKFLLCVVVDLSDQNRFPRQNGSPQ